MNTIVDFICLVTVCSPIVILGHWFFKYLYIKINTANVTSETVIGKVLVRDFEPGQIPQAFILVKWKGIEKKIYGEDMYSKYMTGDAIKLTLIKKFDKNNMLLEQTLEIA